MKRILMLVILLTISGIVSASNVDSINVGGDIQGFTGDTRTILINVVNVNDVDIFQLDLLYDSNVLNITNVVEGDPKIKFAALKPGTNDFNLVVAGSSGPVSGTFTLAKIDVKVIGKANSISPLNLKATAKKIDTLLGVPTGAHDVPISNVQNSQFVVLSSADTDRLNSGDILKIGQSITSQNGQYKLIMQGDGNLVLYDSSGKALWASGTNGHTVSLTIMQNDGNFVMYGPGGAIWTTNTWGHSGSWLTIQNDGNIVLYGSNNKPLWELGVLNPDLSLNIGQSITSRDNRFKFTMQGDGNLVLYNLAGKALWATGTNGKIVWHATMQNDGNFVMYGPSGAIWSTGTWGHPGAWLTTQNDGNVVAYDINYKPLWATGTSQ